MSREAWQRLATVNQFSFEAGQILIEIIRQSIDVKEKIRAAKKLAEIVSKLAGPDWVRLSQAIGELLNQNIPETCKEMLRPAKLKSVELPRKK